MGADCNIAEARCQRIYILEMARVMHWKCEPCGDAAYLKRPSPLDLPLLRLFGVGFGFGFDFGFGSGLPDNSNFSVLYQRLA
jgi:hypothetical protein